MKNSDTAGQKGYDAGKKVSGIKRHIAVDTQGFPHAVAVTTAEVTDRQGALEALKRCRSGLGRVKRLLCDSGYTGDPFAEGVQDILGKHVTVQIAECSELHTFKVMPKRWSVERSFAWLEKNRRLWKNCERRLNTSLQFIHLAFPGTAAQEIANRFLGLAGGMGAGWCDPHQTFVLLRTPTMYSRPRSLSWSRQWVSVP